MKPSKALLVPTLISFCGILQAQEIITAGGDYFSNINGSVSITMGETVIETFSGEANMLTNGFQQSKLIALFMEEPVKFGLTVTASPNPVKELISIKVDHETDEHFSFKLYDHSGKLFLKDNFESPGTDIRFNQYSAGFYMLNIFNDKHQIFRLKIIKL
jgi:hypothetical protein